MKFIICLAMTALLAISIRAQTNTITAIVPAPTVESTPLKPVPPVAAASPSATPKKTDDGTDANKQATPADESFRWGRALKQTLVFLAVQHGYALTQPKTRRALKGPFFRDYFRSVESLSGWDDGGRFFTNYIAHPMEGSFLGFVQIQNDPKGRGKPFGASSAYWKSRMKALAWSAAWSTQFEIGPISQASIGNVGQHHGQTWGDIITTPTVGLAMLVSEDALDRHVIRRLEGKTNNFYLQILMRVLLNPTRSVANVINFKNPWYRDPGLR